LLAVLALSSSATTDVVVAHDAGQQNRHLATEDWTAEVNQAALAEDAVVGLEGHKASRFTQTTSTGLGTASKSKRKSK
jgi:hypothetical protein